MIFGIITLEFAEMQKIVQNKKKTNKKKKKNRIWDQNALFRYFSLQVSKSIVIFEISILEFVQMQSLVQNQIPLFFWFQKCLI